MRPNRQYTWAFLVVSGMLLSGCAAMSKGQADLDLGMKQRGIASWYGDDFHGRTTASGELYDMHALTAAHRTLPLGTVVRIVNVNDAISRTNGGTTKAVRWSGRCRVSPTVPIGTHAVWAAHRI